jgi:hypothetical protein
VSDLARAGESVPAAIVAAVSTAMKRTIVEISIVASSDLPFAGRPERGSWDTGTLGNASCVMN